MTRSLPARVVRRVVRPALRASGRLRTRRASRSIVRSLAEHTTTSAACNAVLCSYRVANDERLAILRVTVGQLHASLGGGSLPVQIADSSPTPYAALADEVWRATDLPTRIDHRQEPLVVALERMLGEVGDGHVYIQFDDMLTTGLSPDYLTAAASLLARAPAIGVVATFWPTAIELDPEHRRIELTAYEVAGAGETTRYRFRGTPWLWPIAIVNINGHRFGIFENFTYGFFLNDLVAPAADMLRRLRWYRSRLGTESAHEVELAAAAKLWGPWWTHVAVCLDGVTLLDIDFAHTEAAVRGEIADNRAAFDAMRDGWVVTATGRPVGDGG